MIRGLKPYQEVKESGVPWLGTVPVHWRVERIKNAYLRVVGGATPASENPAYWDGDIVWVTPADVSRAHRLTTSMKKLTKEGVAACSTKLVPAGSIIVTSRAPVGNVSLAETELCTNQGCKALVPNRSVIEPIFGFLTLRIMSNELQSLATGTTFSEISTSRIATVPVPLPPVIEQQSIVRFLDYGNRLIHQYIGTKRKLIKLLEEQKHAIIQRAVICGLDPNVRLKPSGVEWLGDIPAHWEVRRNGRLFTQRNETGFPDLPILEVSLRTGIRVRNLESSERKQIMSDRAKYKRAVRGDIAYNMMRMWQGAVDAAPVDGLVSPAYIVAKPVDGVDSRYFANLFRIPAYMREVNAYSRGIVKDRNRLYWEDFKQMPSPYPPVSEQALIAEAIERQARGLTRGMEQLQRGIQQIQEYRTRLIADVVTGKLDVRAAAAALPEASMEPEEFEASDLTEEETEEADEIETEEAA